MDKKVFWFVISGLMVLSLVVTACGPATVQTPATTPVASPTVASITPINPTNTTNPEQQPTQATKTPLSGKPQYGGVLTTFVSTEPTYWDDYYGNHRLPHLHQVQQRLLVGDWTKGPAGTGQFSFVNSDALFNTKAGQLAESWTIFPDGHGVYKIRQGIHYALDTSNEASRLVNGRDLTADDIAWALNRLAKTKGSYIQTASPQMTATVNITANDKYTLEIDTSPDWAYEAHYFLDFYAYGDTAKEVIQKYGNNENWRNIIGTGPLILKEYVPGSSLSYARNNNYYLDDPVGPGKGNQLPYIDGMKTLIIPDASTRLAALRTAKVDIGSAIGFDDAKSLRASSPDVKYLQDLENSASNIAFRADKPQQPYHDIRVRQALMYATNFKTIIQQTMGGLGRVPSWPMVYQPEIGDWYLPLDKATQEVQDLYTYNPDKAKQLLKDAGYPQGFKATIVVNNSGSYVDEVSIIKDMWAKVGVDLTLDLKDPAVFSRVQTARTQEDLIYSSTASMLQWTRGFGNVSSNTFADSSMLDIAGPSYIQNARVASQEAWLKGSYDAQAQISRDLIGKLLAEAWAIPYPQKPTWVFWWPWVQNFYGALNVGAFTGPGYQYIWIDQALKKSMGH